MKTLFKIWSVIMICTPIVFNLQAQDTKAAKKATRIAEVKNIINARNYVFVAQFVVPERGGMRSLSGSYDLVVSKNTVAVNLPYFGRMYSAPINDSEGGIKLTSSNFVYKAEQNKKGGWDITIKPAEQSPAGAKDVDLLRLSVSADGKALLMVTGTNRDPISFDGTIATKTDN